MMTAVARREAVHAGSSFAGLSRPTTGANQRTNRRRTGYCWDCGKEGHVRGDGRHDCNPANGKGGKGGKGDRSLGTPADGHTTSRKNFSKRNQHRDLKARLADIEAQLAAADFSDNESDSPPADEASGFHASAA